MLKNAYKLTWSHDQLQRKNKMTEKETERQR